MNDIQSHSARKEKSREDNGDVKKFGFDCIVNVGKVTSANVLSNQRLNEPVDKRPDRDAAYTGSWNEFFRHMSVVVRANALAVSILVASWASARAQSVPPYAKPAPCLGKQERHVCGRRTRTYQQQTTQAASVGVGNRTIFVPREVKVGWERNAQECHDQIDSARGREKKLMTFTVFLDGRRADGHLKPSEA